VRHERSFDVRGVWLLAGSLTALGRL